MKRTAQNKSPNTHKQELLDGIHGAHQQVAQDTLLIALYTPVFLVILCLAHNRELAADHARILFSLAMHILSDWTMRTFSTYMAYPNYGVVVLQDDPGQAQLGIEEVVHRFSLVAESGSKRLE